MKLEVEPVTPERWPDFEAVMGPSGAYAGCWCMWWRVESRKAFEGPTAKHGPPLKRAMKRLVDGGVIPGVIAYVDGDPTVWCSIAPREDFGALERSRTFARIDDKPVWSVVCFYAPRPYRGQGLMAEVLRGACEYARENGARIVEGYPSVPKTKGPAVDVYMGTVGAFERAGFKTVATTPNGRPIMRRQLRPRATKRSRAAR